MNFEFLIVAAILPVVLELIGGDKPSTATNMPNRKKDYFSPPLNVRFASDTTHWRLARLGSH